MGYLTINKEEVKDKKMLQKIISNALKKLKSHEKKGLLTNLVYNETPTSLNITWDNGKTSK